MRFRERVLGAAEERPQRANHKSHEQNHEGNSHKRNPGRPIRMLRCEPRQENCHYVFAEAETDVREWLGRRPYRRASGRLATMRRERNQRTQQRAQQLSFRR
jgi:hypothetical protein